MIHLQARLLPDAETEKALAATLDEFARICGWIHAQAPAHLLDVFQIRAQMYGRARRETYLSGPLCSVAISTVATYRKASYDLAIVSGPLAPQKLVYYDNGLSIKGRQFSISLLLPERQLSERVLLPFDLPRPEDYQTLKSCKLRRGDLTRQGDAWLLDLQLAPTELIYTPEGITYGELVAV